MTDSALIAAARQLSSEVSRLRFSLPVTHVYNPLDYAWAPHGPCCGDSARRPDAWCSSG
jgi:hypothetical protein